MTSLPRLRLRRAFETARLGQSGFGSSGYAQEALFAAAQTDQHDSTPCDPCGQSNRRRSHKVAHARIAKREKIARSEIGAVCGHIGALGWLDRNCGH